MQNIFMIYALSQHIVKTGTSYIPVVQFSLQDAPAASTNI